MVAESPRSRRRSAVLAAERDPRGAVACTHCSLPVPRGLVVEGAAEQFCCAGCRTVHDVIGSCGLDRYYELLRSAPGDGRRANVTGRDYAEFDDPLFDRLYVRQESDGTRSAELYVEGVHCIACLWLLERLPRAAPGVVESRLDVRRSIVRVRWDPQATRLSAAAQALDRLGYPAHPARAASARAARQKEERRQLVRLGVAGACAGNVMLLGLAMYAGLFDAMDPSHLRLFRWVSMGLSVVAVAWPGAVFLRSAVAALRARTVLLDLPIALALVTGTAWGVFNTVRGAGEVYFDSISVLVFALLLGRYLQQRQQRWSADAVELLFSLTPTSATLLSRPGEAPPGPGPAPAARVVPIEALGRGDLVLVRAGESVPADGRIERGVTTLDRALLTGESMPVRAGPGDAASAGTVNIAGAIELRVEATGEDTRIGRLMRLVEEAAERRAPIVRLADRVAGWFTAAVLATALATVAWWWRTSPGAAIEHAIALLIVTCPCALGLATPLAVTVAIGRAARSGILIKGGEVIERLAGGGRRNGLVLLDKTGTATEGRLSIVEIAGDPASIRLAAAAERRVLHPVARAIVSWCDGTGDDDDLLPPRVASTDHVDDLEQVLGGGISAVVDERRVLVGSPAFVGARAIFEPALAAATSQFGANGLTPVAVAVDGRVRAVLGLGDALRPDAATTLASIRRLGWRVGLLSGDHPAVVARVAAALRIEAPLARGGASPEDKVAMVEDAAAAGSVVMVGDGVNDAAALAVATVGVAVHGGAEASLAAADVHLSNPGLASVAELLEGSRRTMRVIRRNLAASLAYNLAAASLAVAGSISPLLAAVIMPLSSLTVVGLSLRGRTFRPIRVRPGVGNASPSARPRPDQR